MESFSRLLREQAYKKPLTETIPPECLLSEPEVGLKHFLRQVLRSFFYIGSHLDRPKRNLQRRSQRNHLSTRGSFNQSAYLRRHMPVVHVYVSVFKSPEQFRARYAHNGTGRAGNPLEANINCSS